MIKIILSDGTTIELDKYEKGIFEDIRNLALGTLKTLKPTVLSGRTCKICNIELPKSKQKLCDSKVCHNKYKKLYQRNWWKKKRAKIKNNNVPINVPVNVI